MSAPRKSDRGSMDNFNPSADEMQSIEKAMKDPKFCKLFAEYAEEIANPKNRQLYEDEIKKMESQSGNDVKFINPEPGFVVKTTLLGKGTKVFVNICQSDMVEKPEIKVVTRDGKKGNMWQVPNSLTTHRDDVDKSGTMCMVYDVVFSPKTLQLAEADKQLRKMVIDTALDGITQRFPIHKLARDNLKFPRLKFKGVLQKQMIREKTNPSSAPAADTDGPNAIEKLMGEFNETIKSTKEEERTTAPKNQKLAAQKMNEPKYSVLHRGKVDLSDYRMSNDSAITTRPKELVVSIELPKCKSAAPVELDIAEQMLTLDCTDPGPYHLELWLPYPVNQDEGSAKFDKSRKTLIVTLPVTAPPVPPPQQQQQRQQKENQDAGAAIESEAPLLEEVASATVAATLGLVRVPGHPAEVVASSMIVTEDEASSGQITPPIVVDLSEGTEPERELGSDAEWIEVPTSDEIVSKKVLEVMTFHQTDKVVSIQLPRSIDDSTTLTNVELGFTEHLFAGVLKTHSVAIALSGTSTSGGTASTIGALVLKFDIELDVDKCSADTSEDTIVIILAKTLTTEIQRMMVGTSATELAERKFLTTSNVDSMAQIAELWTGTDAVDLTAAVQSKSDDGVHIKVTSAAKTGPVPNAAVYSDPNAPTGGGEDDEDFIAAASFRGSSPGYVFKMGRKGLGYYADSAKRSRGKLPAAVSSAGTKDGGDGCGMKNMFNKGYTSLDDYNEGHQAKVDEGPKVVELSDDDDDDEDDEKKDYGPLSTARLDRYSEAVAENAAKGPPPFMPPPGGYDIDESDNRDPPNSATDTATVTATKAEAEAEVTMLTGKPPASASDDLAAMLGPAAAKQAAKQVAADPPSAASSDDAGPSHMQDLTGGTMLSNSLICELE